MTAEPVYLDHQATTPCDPRVVEAMLPFLQGAFGNPSSRTHGPGRAARAALDDARVRLARAFAVQPGEVVFTSGATEANNLVLKGVMAARAGSAPHVVTQVTEHKSILEPLRHLERSGAVRVTRLPVEADGRLDPGRVARALEPGTCLVVLMAANNEIGVLQPLEEVGRHCARAGVALLVDAAQAAGRIPLDMTALGIDLLTVSAHKIHGPKGAGALIVRRSRRLPGLVPLLHGGGQEGGLRSGTPNLPGIAGLARALELCIQEEPGESARLRQLRDHLLERLRAGVGGLRVNGSLEHRLPGNLSVTIPGLDAEGLLVLLDGVALSTGSACDSSSTEPSHVLRALGLRDEETRSTLRFGLGRGTTREAIDRAADLVLQGVTALRGSRRGGLSSRSRGRRRSRTREG